MTSPKRRPRWRRPITIAASIAALVVIAILGILLSRGPDGTTPPFRDANGAIAPASIARIERPILGGVRQSIVIRGRNRAAPVLIWLHGGPGSDETGLWRHYNAALEDHFVVVYWTQRGTGRAYDAAIPRASMRLARFVADLDELVGLLQTRLGPQKVLLVGHSWGTNIGVAYTRAHPEKVAAYVGIGQIANSAEGERRSYAFTLARARATGNAEALADLARIGPPPYPITALLSQRRWLDEFGGVSFRPMPMRELILTSARASEMSWPDLLNFKPGADFSLAALADEVSRFDWLHTATRFAVPVVIIAGRHDRNTDADLAHDYFERLEAPFKAFKWFERSAHSPMFEEPAAFNRYMIETILPIAAANRRPRAGRAIETPAPDRAPQANGTNR